ncbi:MAG: hypothetical protein ACJ741_03465 [Pyrinomonadaceae bacterium]
MRKIFTITVGAACVAVLAAVSFAGGAGLAPLVVVDDQAGQESRAWQRTQPIRYEPFEVEVLVNGSPLVEYQARGRVYVEATSGAEYELRIHNPLPMRVAVALSVDGLNTIDARRTTARDASKWVIQPYGTITVGGWQMSRTHARRFYFTSERDSYANKLGRAEDLGVISAAFFRERAGYAEVEPPLPLDAAKNRGESEEKSTRAQPQSSQPAGAGQARDRAVAPKSDDDEYAATGIGRAVGNDVRWVNLDLEREPSAQVTMRYEYRPALVRLGVLPRPEADRDELRRRERARGFADPKFCPVP